MPKKRHYNKFSKPPSVAPPSLRLSSSSSPQTRTKGQNDRSVNELLAAARRINLNSNAGSSNVPPQLIPSVPPSLRQILQIPETPAPAPRNPQRQRRLRDASGRRNPPGPPPPRSWLTLSRSRHAPSNVSVASIHHWPLPGAYYPDEGSFVDALLRRMAEEWPLQRDWNRYYLYTLPSKLRTALLFYVSTIHETGLTTADLRLVLAGPSESELAEYDLEKPDAGKLNQDIFSLDLTGSVGRSLSLKGFADLLLSVKPAAGETVQDSWDAPEPSSVPATLLPKLTHLSLAMTPDSKPTVSWKQLLSLSNKLTTLTHLSLSGWPAPTLTPNAILAKVVSPLTGRTVDYGGTNAYSHVLDDDWSEAVIVLRALSKNLYNLEYLDLTGCGDWFPALRKTAEVGAAINRSATWDEDEGQQPTAHVLSESSGARVDWAGNWGKIRILRLCSGYAADEGSQSQLSRLSDWKDQAIVVEKHIRAQRQGQGRFITVEKDTLPDGPNRTIN